MSLSELDRLAPGGWFNDEIVNHYLQVELARAYPQHHFFSSFFYTKLTQLAKEEEAWNALQRWDAQKDLSGREALFVPINLGAHWTLLVCDPKQRRFEYYDSLYQDRGRDIVNVRAGRLPLCSTPHTPSLERFSRPRRFSAKENWRAASATAAHRVARA